MVSVLISGLGRIGAGADLATQTGSPWLSHLGAAMATEDISICGLVEPDSQRLAAILDHWPELRNVRHCSSLSQCEGLHADIVVLSGPTEIRMEELPLALAARPRLIILEKPVASKLSDARKIAKIIGISETTVRVNFHRRLDPTHQMLKQALPDIAPIAVVMRYSKGLYHFASHGLDLLLSWFGPVEEIRAHGPAGVDGAVTGDVLVSFDCVFERGFTASFIAVAARDYPIFEIDLYYPDRCFSLEQGGVRIFEKRSDGGAIYMDYPMLDRGRALGAPDQPVSGLTELYEAARDHIVSAKALPGCTLGEALTGMMLLKGVEMSASSGKEFRPARDAL